MSIIGDLTGYASQLAYGSGVDYTSGTFTEVTQLVDFEPPDADFSKVKTTYMNQAAKTHTYQAGFKEPGKAKCSMIFQKALVSTIETTLIGVNKGWQVTWADGSTLKFNGFIDKKGFKNPMDDLVLYVFEIQTSGDTLFTAGA